MGVLGHFRSLAAAAMAGVSLTIAQAAMAQVSPPQPPPTPGDPLKTIPEKMEPNERETDKSLDVPSAPPGSLSDKLGKGEGVIKPPSGVDPRMHVPPPADSDGKMPVIPPPGSPQNPSPVIPK